jgi:transposase
MPAFFRVSHTVDAETRNPQPVRAENPVHGSDQQGCRPSRLTVMITGHVPAVRFSPDHADRYMAAAVPARGDVADCRDLDPAPPARRAAAAAAVPPGPELADRALLAILLGVIPKARRQGLRLLVTPDTMLRWHRDIVRRRWAARSQRGKTGRPATRRNIRALVLRLARENPEWGYRRIHGELAGLGVKIAASTVWEILKKAGIDPAPRRSAPTWPQFLRSQVEAILACDFFTADLLDGTQAHVLAVIEHATRRIRILGVTLHPTGAWTAQQARNLIMDLGEQAHRVKFMIRDRGSNYTAAFDAVLAGAGIRTVLCNVRTPRMNAIAERWIGGCRRKLLDRTLIWNQTICGRSCASTRPTTISTGRTARSTPLPR